MPAWRRDIENVAGILTGGKIALILIYATVALAISFFPIFFSLPWGQEALYKDVTMTLASLLCMFLSWYIVRIHKGTEFRRMGMWSLLTFTIWFFSNILSLSSPIRDIFSESTLSLASASLYFLGYLPLFFVFISTMLSYRQYIARSEMSRVTLVWGLLVFCPMAFAIYIYWSYSREFMVTFLISLFPIINAFLILALFFLLSMYRRVKLQLYFLIITLGALINFIGNLAFMFLDVTGLYSAGPLSDSFFLLAYLVFSFGFYSIVRERIIYFSTIPIAEEEETTAPLYTLEPGTSYMVTEVVPEKSFGVFRDLVTHGRPGLCIVRTFPDKVRSQWKLEKTPILWLSSVGAADSIAPQDLNKLTHIIFEFLKKTQDSVVIIEGIEYLVAQNDFLSVLKVLHAINDLIVYHKSMLIVSVSPDSLEIDEFAHLRRELVLL